MTSKPQPQKSDQTEWDAPPSGCNEDNHNNPTGGDGCIVTDPQQKSQPSKQA